MTKKDLKNYLMRECELSEERVNDMDSYEMINKYLIWNGIIGYTDEIIDVVRAAYGI